MSVFEQSLQWIGGSMRVFHARSGFSPVAGALLTVARPWLSHRACPACQNQCEWACIMVLPARDALEPGELPAFFRQRIKPALNLQAVPEARTVAVVDVVAADRQSRSLGGDLKYGQSFPACVV